MASSPPKQDSFELLASDDSTKMDEESIIDYWYEYLEDDAELPANFDQSLIDVFLRVLSDQQSVISGDTKRINASYIICTLLESEVAEFTHVLLQKGIVAVIVQCINKEEDEKVRHNCLFMARRVARHCSECEEAIGRARVLETIVELMHSDIHFSDEAYSSLIWSCHVILCETAYYTASVISKISCLIVKIIAQGMRRFPTNDDIQEDLMRTLVNLTYTFRSNKQDGMEVIDAILNEKELIENISDAIATGGSDLVSNTLKVILNITSIGTDNQIDIIIMGEGFMNMIIGCLNSLNSNVRFTAMQIIYNIVLGPCRHILMIVNNPLLITQLMCLMDHEDAKLQTKLCWVWVHLLFKLNLYRTGYEQREDIIREGVQKIIDFQIMFKADSRLVKQIKEILARLLLSHAEFLCVFKTQEILIASRKNENMEKETEKDCGESIAFIISEEPEPETRKREEMTKGK